MLVANLRALAAPWLASCRFSTYDKQHRGDANAYARYLKGMEASMQQKVAVVAAHIMSEGRIADMGMGSGSGSAALASLYPNLQVTGIDNNAEMVLLAQKNHVLHNLQFIVSDAAKKCLGDATQEAIINSSVLHHVTSFNDYRHEEAFKAIQVQVEQLVDHGVVIVRDFLSLGEQIVQLDLPENDGEGTNPLTCSTAAILDLS